MAERSEQQRTIAFLRMAAIELRRIAERTPEVAYELRHMAEKIDAEAAEMESRD